MSVYCYWKIGFCTFILVAVSMQVHIVHKIIMWCWCFITASDFKDFCKCNPSYLNFFVCLSEVTFSVEKINLSGFWIMLTEASVILRELTSSNLWSMHLFHCIVLYYTALFNCIYFPGHFVIKAKRGKCHRNVFVFYQSHFCDRFVSEV